jgi:DNA-binding CsgD family transcriptional regulator
MSPAGSAIGRDDELGLVRAFLDDLAGGPAGLVLFGEPGIGKTILWRAGVDRAREQFAQVLTCRGVEAEAALSFAALSELLGDVLTDVADTLPPPRRRALEVALLLTEPDEKPPEPLAIGLAVHDLLRELAKRGPLLVAVDDVHWLDPGSAGVLEVALRRLRNDPIGVLVTARPPAGALIPLGLERSLPEQRLTVLSVGPLSLGALHHLIVERLGLELSRSELARIQEAAGGNPFFALELGREFARTEARPAAGRSLRVPESLRELLGGRLAELPGETADVLLQVSALARPTIEVVAAAHGDVERVRESMSVAVAEEIVELDDSRVRFGHPLLASICYERAPIWKRRAVHRALAAAVGDLEERARHLALAAEGPDARVAEELDAAAEQAAARGAPASAAELSELAAQLTPDDPVQTRQRRFRAARFHRIAGDPARAETIIEELLDGMPIGGERADLLFELSYTRMGRTSGQLEAVERAQVDVEGDDARAATFLGLRSWARLLETDNVGALADARAALEKAERVGDPAQLAQVIGRLGQVEMWAGEVTPGLLERGAEIALRERIALDFLTNPRFWLGRLRVRQGRLDEARAMLAELEAESEARGDEQTRCHTVWYRVILEWFCGNLQPALDLATEAYEVGEQTRFPSNAGWNGRIKALLETDLGLVEQARASTQDGVEQMGATGNEIFRLLSVGVLGRLELLLGNVEAAGEHLAEIPDQLAASGLNDPTQPVWADAIETLVVLGELERARRYLDVYEQNSQRFSSGWALACVARSRGLLRAAEGDPDGALAALDQALRQLTETPFPLELGRTLMCRGVVCRQAMQKRAARDSLEEAAAIFEGLGARLWALKARGELGRISGRRADGDELTEAETRVAQLAAAGRSNKEIAAELFMGLSTVEAHLSHVYRKLGINSRAGLGSRLATTVKAVEETPQS